MGQRVLVQGTMHRSQPNGGKLPRSSGRSKEIVDQFFAGLEPIQIVYSFLHHYPAFG